MDWRFRKDLDAQGYKRDDVIKVYRDYRNGLNNCLNFQLQSLAAAVVNRAAVQINRAAKENNIDLFSRSFSGWTWPISSEIIYTDSIPILSIILRPFLRFIRIDFQYFSIVSLVNLIATYYCGLLIGNYFKLKIGLSSSCSLNSFNCVSFGITAFFTSISLPL